MKRITIDTAKEISDSHEAEVVIILAMNDKEQQVTTFGKNSSSSKYAADTGNKIKELLGWGKEDCNAKPLKRECNNCDFFTLYERQFDIRIDEREGMCNVEPTAIRVCCTRTGCRYFRGTNWG